MLADLARFGIGDGFRAASAGKGGLGQKETADDGRQRERTNQ